MDINITLVLQGAQFFCVYFILYRFIFAPALSILNHDESIKDLLLKKIEGEEKIKNTALECYTIKHDEHKSQLIQAIPQASTQIIQKTSMKNIASYAIEIIELSKQDKYKIQSFIIDNVSRVIKK